MGWEKEAHTRFVTLCHRIKLQRQENMSEELEEAFQVRATREYTGGHGSSRRRKGADVPSFD
jgi:hypothetical protein